MGKGKGFERTIVMCYEMPDAWETGQTMKKGKPSPGQCLQWRLRVALV